MRWPADYVGIQYKDKGRSIKGADCYGLCWVIKELVENKSVINYLNYDEAKDKKSVQDAIFAGVFDWDEVSFEDRKEFDLIVFNIGGFACHIGTIYDERYMIHTLKGCNSAVEDYTKIVWKKRIQGIYRWPK